MRTPIKLLNGSVVVNPMELLSRSRAAENDVAVLSGSLLEGFGNLQSDLDLYVICEQLPKKAPEGPAMLVVREDNRVRRVNEILAGEQNMILDIQYYTFRELDTLARSLNMLYLEARQDTRHFNRTLLHEDEDLIHKLLTGRVLQDGTGTFDVNRSFDLGRFCFLKYRNETGNYSEFRDLVGTWMAGDLDTCLHIARGYLIAQVSGMMFLAGSTNPRPKWFVRKLALLGTEYVRLRDEVMLWMHSERRTEGQKRTGIETACRLIDLTFSHNRSLLDTNSQYFSAAEARTLTEHEFSRRGMYDKEAMAEWQLRRLMFGEEESSMMSLLRTQATQNQVTAFANAQHA